jgi:hypothetical protein
VTPILRDLQESADPTARDIVLLAARVAEHPLFFALRSLDDVRGFMAHHVWAVWDFMTLLKSLQAELAPTTLPWRPRDASIARLINEIVLGEESDLGPDGRAASHFEVYLAAMETIGADTSPVRRFLAALARGIAPSPALDEAGAPAGAARFVRGTLACAAGPLPARLAAFTIGREDIIPAMFGRIVAGLGRSEADERRLAPLVWYLDRHITVDGGEHGPMAARLFARVCLASDAARASSLEAAELALRERLALWDATLAAIGS